MGRITPGRIATALGKRLAAPPAAVRMAIGPQRRARYHNHAPQKSPWRMALDNLIWAARRGRVNDGYFLLGLDAVDAPRPSPLHDHHALMDIITRQIRHRKVQTLASLLRDKYLFAFVAQGLSYPSPRNLALLGPDKVVLLAPRRDIAYDRLAAGMGDIDGFCKPIRGAEGGGCFPLTMRNGALLAGDCTISAQQLQSRIGSAHLLQSRIVQHEDLSRLYPASINSLRLITTSMGGRVSPFQAALRIGTFGSIVDNWSAGGLETLVDMAAGCLKGRGLFKPGHIAGGAAAVSHHPDTGLRFDGFPIPMLPEAVDLACRFHADLGALVTIAWDVAFTPSGPLIIEGNTHWDARVHMALDPGFEHRYRALLERAEAA